MTFASTGWHGGRGGQPFTPRRLREVVMGLVTAAVEVDAKEVACGVRSARAHREKEGKVELVVVGSEEDC